MQEPKTQIRFVPTQALAWFEIQCKTQPGIYSLDPVREAIEQALKKAEVGPVEWGGSVDKSKVGINILTIRLPDTSSSLGPIRGVDGVLNVTRQPR